jgi:hypothetical protein
MRVNAMLTLAGITHIDASFFSYATLAHERHAFDGRRIA